MCVELAILSGPSEYQGICCRRRQSNAGLKLIRSATALVATIR